MKKQIIAVAAVLSLIPGAAFAASDPYAPPKHLVQPLHVDCGKGGVIADMAVTQSTSAKAAFDTLAGAMSRYKLACGSLPASVKILITNK